MKPFIFSTKKNNEAGTNEWIRGCEEVSYSKNTLKAKLRECAPDYEFDHHNIHYYIYEDEDS